MSIQIGHLDQGVENYDTWALMKSQLMKLRSFHHKCVRQLCGYTMFQVKEHKIKKEVYLKEANLQPIDTLITVRQLRFLTRVAEMDESWLTRQVMSSQGTIANGKRAGRHKTTKQAYRDALKTAGLFTNGNDIKTNDWIECLTDEGTPSKIEQTEQTLNLDAGTFKKKKNS
jgi:hypothetical protein